MTSSSLHHLLFSSNTRDLCRLILQPFPAINCHCLELTRLLSRITISKLRSLRLLLLFLCLSPIPHSFIFSSSFVILLSLSLSLSLSPSLSLFSLSLSLCYILFTVYTFTLSFEQADFRIHLSLRSREKLLAFYEKSQLYSLVCVHFVVLTLTRQRFSEFHFLLLFEHFQVRFLW